MDPSIQTPASQCSTFPPLDRPVRPTQFTGSHCRFAHAGSKAPAPLRKTKHLHETRSKCGYAVTVFFFFRFTKKDPPTGARWPRSLSLCNASLGSPAHLFREPVGVLKTGAFVPRVEQSVVVSATSNATRGARHCVPSQYNATVQLGSPLRFLLFSFCIFASILYLFP